MLNPALIMTVDEPRPSVVRQNRSVTVAIVLLSFFGVTAAAWAATPLVAEPAPDFVLKSADGHNLRLSELRGEIVIVNFWSSKCRPCREQLEWLGTIDAQNQVSILSVNIDRNSDAAVRAIEDQGIEYPVLFDTDKTVIRLYDPDKLPMAVMIDQQGFIRYIHSGYKNSDGTLYAQQLAKLLSE